MFGPCRLRSTDKAKGSLRESAVVEASEDFVIILAKDRYCLNCRSWELRYASLLENLSLVKPILIRIYEVRFDVTSSSSGSIFKSSSSVYAMNDGEGAPCFDAGSISVVNYPALLNLYNNDCSIDVQTCFVEAHCISFRGYLRQALCCGPCYAELHGAAGHLVLIVNKEYSPSIYHFILCKSFLHSEICANHRLASVV